MQRTVRHGAAAVAPTLDVPLEALANAHAGNIDKLALLEDRLERHRRPQREVLEPLGLLHLELREVSEEGRSRLLAVPALGLLEVLRLRLLVPELRAGGAAIVREPTFAGDAEKTSSERVKCSDGDSSRQGQRQRLPRGGPRGKGGGGGEKGGEGAWLPCSGELPEAKRSCKHSYFSTRQALVT
jgi:hypothetical protein